MKLRVDESPRAGCAKKCAQKVAQHRSRASEPRTRVVRARNKIPANEWESEVASTIHAGVGAAAAAALAVAFYRRGTALLKDERRAEERRAGSDREPVAFEPASST
jgi:hypothetical protein